MKQREHPDNSGAHRFRRRVNSAVIAPRHKRSGVSSV
jgi:hypothetical protein